MVKAGMATGNDQGNGGESLLGLLQQNGLDVGVNMIDSDKRFGPGPSQGLGGSLVL